MGKILFLHGFAQNPDEIASKCRQLRHFVPAEFSFPAAAIKLMSYDGDMSDRARDIDGSTARYAWNLPTEDMSTNLINLEMTLARLVPLLEQQGPFDGIMGFSQGAAVASAICSLLEKPSCLIRHPAFKFAVLFCGARPSSSQFDHIYRDIETPSLHLVGKQDIMVPTERSLGLANAFNRSAVVYHPGNHFIPQGTVYTRLMADFVNNHLQHETKLELESVNDLPSKADATVVGRLQYPVTLDGETTDRLKKARKVRLIKRPPLSRIRTLAC